VPHSVTGFLEPAYGARSLADVLPSVGAALGARVPGWPIELRRLVLPERVVLPGWCLLCAGRRMLCRQVM